MTNQLIQLNLRNSYTFQSEDLEKLLANLSRKFQIKNYKLYKAVYREYKRNNWYYDYPYNYRYLYGKSFMLALEISKKKEYLFSYGFFRFVIDNGECMFLPSTNAKDGLDVDFIKLFIDGIHRCKGFGYIRRDIPDLYLKNLNWEKFIHSLWCITNNYDNQKHMSDFCKYLMSTFIDGFVYHDYEDSARNIMLRLLDEVLEHNKQNQPE